MHKLLSIIAVMSMLTGIQLLGILYKLDRLKTETHIHYLLPRDGQCKNVFYKGKEQMRCYWELR